MSSAATPRLSTLLVSSAAVVAMLGAATIHGCAPSDVGALDMARSKAIAAEKGLDARRGGVASPGRSKVKRGTDPNTSPAVRELPSRSK